MFKPLFILIAIGSFSCQSKKEVPTNISQKPKAIKIQVKASELPSHVEILKPVLIKKEPINLIINKVKKYESYKATPYICPAGVKTIGFGLTGERANRSYISRKDAHNELLRELKEAKEIVLRNVKVPLNDYQLASLTSFTFNCGERNLRKLINGTNRLNQGNYHSIAKIMPKYNKGAGKPLKGLTIRRMEEVEIFQGNL